MIEPETGCCDSVINDLEACCQAEDDARSCIDYMLTFFEKSGADFPAYSMQLMQRVRELSRQDEYAHGEAWAYCNLGWLLLDRSETLPANLHLREALQIFDQLDERKGRISCLNGLGVCASLNGDLGQAMALFRESLELASPEATPSQYYSVVANLSLCLINQGDYLEALAALDRSDIAAITGPANRAKCLLCRAMAFRKLGLLEKAQDSLSQASAVAGIHAKLGDQIRLEQARLLKAAGQPEEANRLLENALGRFRRAADRYHQAECLFTLGELSAEAGQPSPAQLLFNQALDVLVDTGCQGLEQAIQASLRRLGRPGREAP